MCVTVRQNHTWIHILTYQSICNRSIAPFELDWLQIYFKFNNALNFNPVTVRSMTNGCSLPPGATVKKTAFTEDESLLVTSQQNVRTRRDSLCGAIILTTPAMKHWPSQTGLFSLHGIQTVAGYSLP